MNFPPLSWQPVARETETVNCKATFVKSLTVYSQAMTVPDLPRSIGFRPPLLTCNGISLVPIETSTSVVPNLFRATAHSTPQTHRQCPFSIPDLTQHSEKRFTQPTSSGNNNNIFKTNY
jgi:hypothetical protein